MSRSFREEVLEQLHKLGSNVEKPHCFDFFLYVPTETAAKHAADKVRERHFIAEVQPGASGRNWLCKASISINPEIAPLDEIGSFFKQIASTLYGEFDGWESDVVKSSD